MLIQVRVGFTAILYNKTEARYVTKLHLCPIPVPRKGQLYSLFHQQLRTPGDHTVCGKKVTDCSSAFYQTLAVLQCPRSTQPCNAPMLPLGSKVALQICAAQLPAPCPTVWCTLEAFNPASYIHIFISF